MLGYRWMGWGGGGGSDNQAAEAACIAAGFRGVDLSKEDVEM